MDSSLVFIWDIGKEDGAALGLGDCGCGAAVEVYFQQILEDACGQLWSQTLTTKLLPCTLSESDTMSHG